MATLLPTISSDEEDAEIVPPRDDDEADATVDSDSDEVDSDFEFGGGAFGEDLDLTRGGGGGSSDDAKGWSYGAALAALAAEERTRSDAPARTDVSNIIAAARSGLKQKEQQKEERRRANEAKNDDGSDDDESASASDDDEEERGSETDDESDEDETDDEEDDANDMETDHVRDQKRKERAEKSKTKDAPKARSSETRDEHGSDDDGSDDDDASSSSDSVASEERREAAKAAAFFDSSSSSSSPRGDDVEAFSQLNLSRPLLRGVASAGYVTPTPIQARVIPAALAGRDVCASAVTGSGKTAAFLLPLLERVSRGGRGRALVLAPTRELAAQCHGMLRSLSRHLSDDAVTSCLVVGGNKNLGTQAARLRSRPDVVVATPGRILDHLTNSSGVHLDDLDCLVLDEADRLLELGFQEEVMEIVHVLPRDRQTLLFSATMNTKVDDLVRLSLRDPVRVKVESRETNDRRTVEVAPRLEQEFVRIRRSNEDSREAVLLSLLHRDFRDLRTIVFADTKVAAHRLMILAGLCGVACAELHGNLTQTQRLEALERFRDGEVRVLFATDLAARGLDVPDVRAVLNLEMPADVDTYVHRIGRTARAGRKGRSCTLIGEGRRGLMKRLLRDDDGDGDAKQSKTRPVVRSRTVPPAVVAHFRARIASLEPTVEEVLQAEAVARADRLAEMEATRALNIIQHADEIKSRPAREWFKGKAEKRADAEAAAAKREPKTITPEGTGTHRMSRKKRRAREATEELRRFQEETRKEREETGKGGTIMTDRTVKACAISLKKEQQLKEKERFNRSVNDEDMERDRKRKKFEARKIKKPVGQHSLGNADLFDDERVSFAQKNNNDGEDKAPVSRYRFTEFDPNRSFGKGGKKSVKSFKSKSKYKRR